MMAQQQQQYFQYTSQPGGSYPGATAYAYPGAQQPQTMDIQPGTANTTALKNKFDASSSRAVVVLATIQVIIGCCCISFQSTSIYLESSVDPVYTSEHNSTGIWCGILFLLTGAFGLSAGKRNSILLITTFMVMNMLTSVAVWILLSFALVNMQSVQECQRKGIYTSLLSSVPRTCKDILYSVWIAMDALMITVAVVEFIIAVTSAIYSCRVVCNCPISYHEMIAQQPGSGFHVATTGQLPSQQQQHQAMENKPYPVPESCAQYPAAGAATTDSYGQPSYAQPGQRPYYQQQQVPLLASNSQTAYGPYAAWSETAIREAAPSGAGYPSPQAYYPPAAGDSSAVHSAPELPPSYDAAMKL